MRIIVKDIGKMKTKVNMKRPKIEENLSVGRTHTNYIKDYIQNLLYLCCCEETTYT